MTRVITSLVSILLLVADASAQVGTRPRGDLTPGASREHDASVVCKAGYSRLARNVSQYTKQRVFERYHVEWDDREAYVIDHLIPVELGGANSIDNLWPQLRSSEKTGDLAKNKLGNLLKRFVCKGLLDLDDAQFMMSKDWQRAYGTYFHTTYNGFTAYPFGIGPSGKRRLIR